MSELNIAASTWESNLVDCPRCVPTCLIPSGPLDSIGNTPLVRLRAASERTGCEILAKAEFMNPGGSVKDRIVRGIVEAAEARGDLVPGMTLMEVTSGNTGIALAMVGVMKGYPVRIRMPATVSAERRYMIRAFGAELELFDAINRIAQVVEETEAEMAKNGDVFLTRQFANEDNVRCHETTTGPEILTQTGGRFDAFVMGVGTGGTVMGVGRALRAVGHKARVIAVEPDESAVMSGDAAGCHGIQGLADGFIPPLVDVSTFHSVIRVPTEDAKQHSARLGKEEGLLVGISSGANVIAAEKVAMDLGPGHTVVTVLCDRGERYLSMRESLRATHSGEVEVSG